MRLLFDELPIFTLAPAKAITSGAWRADVQPIAVWSGTMTDAMNPVFDEAAALVDSTTTFANVQTLLRRLRDQIAKRTLDALDPSVDDVESEIYAGGTGVVRTYASWFPVSGFAAS